MFSQRMDAGSVFRSSCWSGLIFACGFEVTAKWHWVGAK